LVSQKSITIIKKWLCAASNHFVFQVIKQNGFSTRTMIVNIIRDFSSNQICHLLECLVRDQGPLIWLCAPSLGEIYILSSCVYNVCSWTWNIPFSWNGTLQEWNSFHVSLQWNNDTMTPKNIIVKNGPEWKNNSDGAGMGLLISTVCPSIIIGDQFIKENPIIKGESDYKRRIIKGESDYKGSIQL